MPVNSQIRLNSKPYGITTRGWTDGVVERFAGRESPQGSPTQDNLLTPLSVQFAPGVDGFGFERAISAGGPVAGFWDCTCDVSSDGYRLSRLSETSTLGGGILRVSTLFNGVLWALVEANTLHDVFAHHYNGSTTTWDTASGGYVLDVAVPSRALDIITVGDTMIALVASANDHLTRYSTDGASWSTPAADVGANLLSNVISASEDISAGQLSFIGDETVAVLWHEANGTITFYSSADKGVNWTDEEVDIVSSDGPLGVAVYQGTDAANTQYLHVLTAEGLYEINVAPATWTIEQIYTRATQTHSGRNNRLLRHWDGKLWFAETVVDEPFRLVSYSSEGGGRTFETNHGLYGTQGVPSDMLGSVEWMVSSPSGLLVSIGGGSTSKTARIVKIVKSDYGTYSVLPVVKDSSAAENRHLSWMAVSDRDDGTQRLHYAIKLSLTSTSMRFIANPFTPPSSGVAIKYESSGTILFPVVNAGMPAIPKTWLQFTVEADDLSGTNSDQHIDMTYGIDGAARTTTSVADDFLSGGKSLGITATEAGTNATNIGLAVTLKRGSTNTNTPVLRTLTANYIPEVQRIRWWECEIDIGRSAFLQRSTYNRSVVRTNINTLMDAGTQVPVRFPGESADVYVTIKKPKFSVFPSSGVVRSGLDTFQRHGGFVKVRFEEAY